MNIKLINEIIKLNLEFTHQDDTSADELISHLLRFGFKGLQNMTEQELKTEFSYFGEELGALK
jgi:hypothetical protein